MPQMGSTTAVVAPFVTAVARVGLLEIRELKRLLGHVEEREHKPLILFAAGRSTLIACFPLAYSQLEHLLLTVHQPLMCRTQYQQFCTPPHGPIYVGW